MELYRWLRTQWDRAAAVGLSLLGAISLLLGWLGTSEATLPTEQIPYLASGGLFGLFALGLAATLWLSADLRDEWRKLDDIHRGLQTASEPTLTSLPMAEALPSVQAEPVATAEEESQPPSRPSRRRQTKTRTNVA